MRTSLPGVRVTTPLALGALIRERRKASGTTLVDAAALAGVSVRFLHEVEHGKRTASIGKLLQILERIGLEVWVLPRGAAPR